MGTTNIDGLEIHFHSRGREAAGVPVLYVHGTGCNGRVFVRHMEAICDRHPTVAIDLPGHGSSDGDGFRGVADYAHFVGRLALGLGLDRYVVAGHSLGGGVAQAVAVYNAKPLAGLMLIDTGARLRVRPEILETARRTALGNPPPTDPRQQRASYASQTPLAVIEEVSELIREEDPKITYKDWIADDSFDFMSRLRSFNLPALAICGEEDSMTPVRYHEYFRAHMPDCRLRVIPGAGHWPFAEQPADFDEAVLDFLQELDSAASRR